MGSYLEAYKARASQVLTEDDLNSFDEAITYIGFDRNVELPEGSTVITLNNLGTLIPE